MSESRQILQMLQEGQITVDEADELLRAIAKDTEAKSSASDTADLQANAEPSISPNVRRFRRLCYVPFAISLAILLLSVWILYALYLKGEGAITFGFVVMVAVSVLTFAAAAASLWMTMVPWLHVRVQGRDGKRIAISLPLPLTLVDWSLRLARHFVDEGTMAQLDIATEILSTTRKAMRPPLDQPITVDMHEDDEQVQVYIG